MDWIGKNAKNTTMDRKHLLIKKTLTPHKSKIIYLEQEITADCINN